MIDFGADLIDKIEQRFGKVSTIAFLASIVFFVPVFIFAKALDIVLKARDALLTAIGIEYVIEFTKFYGAISLGFLLTYFLICVCFDIYFSRRWNARREKHRKQMAAERESIDGLMKKLDESMVDYEGMIEESKGWHEMVKKGISQLDLKKAELEAIKEGASAEALQGILPKAKTDGDK